MSKVTQPFNASNLRIRERVESKSGTAFGRWIVVGPEFQAGVVWCVVAECQCGTCRVVNFQSLLSGKTKSCGCLSSSARGGSSNGKFVHGETVNGKETKLYSRWRNMRNRCHNPKVKDFRFYGARGISVCEEWRKSFSAFRNWAMNSGYEETLSLDRIDPDGNYEAANCRWISLSENCKRKRPRFSVRQLPAHV